ncbi:hypothetical protein HMPREF3039_02099 [Akkermansia sp. KLE1798]|nr:hypothetical protein HMPREF3039_02099 [Akkermansia sp. KLE1798]
MPACAHSEVNGRPLPPTVCRGREFTISLVRSREEQRGSCSEPKAA